MSKKSHPLYTWAQANGRKIGWLAKQAGISASSMTAYLSQSRETPMPVKLAFEHITSGEVRASQWP